MLASKLYVLYTGRDAFETPLSSKSNRIRQKRSEVQTFDAKHFLFIIFNLQYENTMYEEKKDEESISSANHLSSLASEKGCNESLPSSALKRFTMSTTGKRLKEHFSSTPIDPEIASSFTENSRLTDAEKAYLESLLKTGDPSLIERASQRLCDPVLFPHSETCTRSSTNVDAHATLAAAANVAFSSAKRRDSQVQQELFRLHEMGSVKPSHFVKRMNYLHQNSLLEDSEGRSSSRESDPAQTELNEAVAAVDTWNPFQDVSSWIDGSQGVEVGDNGIPIPKEGGSETAQLLSHAHDPFRILGTAADDVSCHPHVLSPPLMESLLAFVPEPFSQQNFWLKYSLVRDGSNMWNFLRQVRASEISFLAIETVDGHVFGSFTCQAWRLSQGWYGRQTGEAAFLWKMRRSRDVDPISVARSIVEQVNKESEIQVYPYREGNAAVQYCSRDQLMLGQGELFPHDELKGKHYGHGLYLDASLLKGSTSNSETFGNPCLVNPDERGAMFEVSNLEVWTLTSQSDVESAQQLELSQLFLTNRDRDQGQPLNFMKILVGGPI